MHSNLWRWIERVSWWLEDADERQTVLGDIQERGIRLSALRQLVGLVLLRQLQAWKSWRPWVLTPLLAIPLIGIVVAPIIVVVGGVGTTIELALIAGLIDSVYAFAFAFTLGSLGGKKVLSMVPILMVVATYTFISAMRAFPFRIADVAAQNLVELSTPFLVGLPICLGLWRGLLDVRLTRTKAAAMAIAFVGVYAIFFAEMIRLGGVVVPHLVLLLAAFWPVLYMVVSPWTARRTEAVHAR
jgi:hypothetical protein